MVDYKNRSYSKVTDIKNRSKVEKVIDLIPDDVKSIIDIGCGNGLITNEIGKYYNVLGVDINESKLKFVQTDKLQSSCDNIERPDESFDLVFSSEMLEHLVDDLFKNTLNEFDRLSSKYIMISVPNNEPLHKLMVKCEKCGKAYNKNGHLRTFSENSIQNLHENWKVVHTETFGRRVRKYRKSLASMKHQMTPPSAWIPNYWIKNQGVNYHFCTNCGYKNNLDYKFHPLAFAIDSLNLVTTGKDKSHLLALFEKRK